MKLDIKNLISTPFGQKESYNVELFNEKIDEDILAERTIGKVELTRLEDEILAQFDIEAKVRMLCDRCLVEFKQKIPLSFSQEYLINRKVEVPRPVRHIRRAQHKQAHGKQARDKDDERPVVEKDFKIDITEPIRQEALTHIPVQKLCEEKCKGLCAHCGANLNVGKCKCKKSTPHLKI